MVKGPAKLLSSTLNRLYHAQKMSQSPIIVPAVGKHTATVIMSHGLGDSGYGWAFLAQEYRKHSGLSEVSFIFPHAPSIPITVNMGARMPGWYDILSFDDTINKTDDEAGIAKSRETLHGLISEEIKKGISSDRIVLGGFSQGGAMALNAGLTYDKPIAGVVGLSSYLLMQSKFTSLLPEGNPNANTKVFMGHGEADPLVKFAWGKATAEFLKAQGYDVTFKSYPGLPHSASDQELGDLADWLQERLPPLGSDAKADL